MKRFIKAVLLLIAVCQLGVVGVSAKEFSDYESLEPTGMEIVVMEMLEDSMGNLTDFRLIEWSEGNFDGKAILLEPTDPEFEFGVVMASMGDRDAVESWDDMVLSFEELSGNISDLLGDDYMMMMMNPADYDLMILSVWDGILIYDAVNDYDVSSIYFNPKGK